MWNGTFLAARGPGASYRRALTLLLIIAAAVGCGRRSDRRVEASDLLDESSGWADEPVKLAEKTEWYSLMLQSLTAVDKIDTDSRFQLYGILANSNNASPERLSIYYVDRESPDSNDLISYRTELVTTVEIIGDYYGRRSGSRVRVQLRLDRESPALVAMGAADPTLVDIGTATFAATGAGTIVAMQPAQGLRTTLVYSDNDRFPGNGQLAAHYGTLNYEIAAPLRKCGQNNPDNCAIIPLETVCPDALGLLSTDCYPPAPKREEAIGFAQFGQIKNGVRQDQAVVLDEYHSRERQHEAVELTFVATSILATPANNQDLCEDLVSYLTTSPFDGRVNRACQIRVEPSAEPINGHLACRVSVAFDQMIDVGDHACNVTAVFLGDSKKEYQTAQVIERTLRD